MSIKDVEKDRRAKKKLYEKVDSIFDDVMSDPEFAEGIVKDWALADPKGFMQLMEKRLPKVQVTDQDLQKTLISLKSMMLGLPDVEDIALALKTANAKGRKLEAEVKDLTTQNAFLLKQNKDLKCQTK